MPQDEEEWDEFDALGAPPAAPPEGWTLDNLPPDLPEHVELIRGTLVVSLQKAWHLLTVRMFEYGLVEQAPEQFFVFREMAVKENQRSAPQPDLSIIHAAALDEHKSIYLPRDFVLAGEVVSPGSETRDRIEKPVIYADMGIATYWLIERGERGVPTVHEHRLIGGTYRLVKTHIDRLVTEVPFPIDIPLANPARR